MMKSKHDCKKSKLYENFLSPASVFEVSARRQGLSFLTAPQSSCGCPDRKASKCPPSPRQQWQISFFSGCLTGAGWWWGALPKPTRHRRIRGCLWFSVCVHAKTVSSTVFGWKVMSTGFASLLLIRAFWRTTLFESIWRILLPDIVVTVSACSGATACSNNNVDLLHPVQKRLDRKAQLKSRWADLVETRQEEKIRNKQITTKT